jgi:hypothetical protein
MQAYESVRSYLRFATAREFWNADNTQDEFIYQKSTLEKIGSVLVSPLWNTSDAAFRNIRQPLFITALTAAALATTTLAYYPEEVFEMISKVVPLNRIEPWTVKLTMWIASQTLILGFGLRTYGRLDNHHLKSAWDTKAIIAVPIGAVRK